MGQSLMSIAARAIRPARFVVDVGPGIRPQSFVKAERHLCIEPHWEYTQWLRARGYEVIEGTAQDALPQVEQHDAIFLLDVIEHLEKAQGREVLALAQQRAAQVVVFTPLGFIPQESGPGNRDAWGMRGGLWQRHRSGWMPDEFEGWKVMVDAGFHGKRGGAFFAIWTRP